MGDISRSLLWGTDCGGPGWCWWHLHAQHKVSSCLYEFFYRNHPFCSVQRQSWRKSVWTRVFTRRSEMSLVESIALRAPIYLELLNARYDYFQKHTGPEDPMAMLTKGICQRNSNHTPVKLKKYPSFFKAKLSEIARQFQKCKSYNWEQRA